MGEERDANDRRRDRCPGARRPGRHRHRNPASGQADAPSAAFDAQKTYPVDALKADLQVLWDILEEGHGGFDRYTPAAQLRKSFDAVGSGLTGPLTESDFYVRLLPLIAEIKDGHTRLSLSPGAGASLDSRPDPSSLRVPFPRRQGLCPQGPEPGPERRRGRGAPGHRRPARPGDPRGAPSAHSERRRDPDRQAPPPRIPGRLRQAARPALRPAGILSGPLPPSSRPGRPGRSRFPGSRRATSPVSCARDTRKRRSAGRSTSWRSTVRRPF